MLGLDFIKYVQDWRVSHYVSTEDFADKFNSLFSPLLLILSALVISAKQYVIRPISCYCEKTAAAKTIDYVENYCWTSGTLAFAEHEQLPITKKEWDSLESRQINYYQWVPFVLAIQCSLYYLPHLFWQAMVSGRLGTDAQFMVTEAAGVATESGEEKRDQRVTHLAKLVLRMQTAHREYRHGRLAEVRLRLVRLAGVCFPSKRLGTALVFAYFVAKLLYLVNSVGQLYMMHRFLGLENWANASGRRVESASKPGGSLGNLLGWDLVTSISSGHDLQSGLFPRSALCRVRLFSVGYQVLVCQCALPVNMLIEKVYIMLWLWTLLAAMATAVSIPVWVARIGLSFTRRRFVRRQLFLAGAIDKTLAEERRWAEKFSDELLRRDGVFLFKMMQLNAGDVIMGQILKRLFELWRRAEEIDDTEKRQEQYPAECTKAFV